MKVAAIIRDLMLFSRIESIVAAAGADLVRVDRPTGLPPAADVDLLLVDWSDRTGLEPVQLRTWLAEAPDDARPRLILFGQHTDLTAHAAARAAGLGPMHARSKLLSELPELVERAG